MKKITKREICLGVPDRWAAAYKGYNDERKSKITSDLMALTVSQLTPEIIAKTIGNDSWTRIECRECESDCNEVVLMADTLFCGKCLSKASALVPT